MTQQREVSRWTAFWNTLTKVDHSKINTWIAFRNALGVAIPLAVGIAFHNAVGAVAVTTGALNVSYSDGKDPYLHRAKRMLLWTVLGGIAVFIGSITGSHSVLAVLLAAAWAFVAGLGVAVSTRTGDLGLNTLVALIVFGARAAFGVKGAAITGALVIAGGLVQMLFALFFWPLRRDDPERVALAQVYGQLAKELAAEGERQTAEDAGETLLEKQLNAPAQALQETLDALGGDHSVEGDRFRMLLDQVDRIRLSAFALRRVRAQLESEHGAEELETVKAEVDDVLRVAAALAQAAGDCLTPGKASPKLASFVEQLNREVDDISRRAASGSSKGLRDSASAADVLAGQLRAVVALVNFTSFDPASVKKQRRERVWGWRLELGGWLGIMRANLNPRSAIFRHALRLALCVAIGDAIGRAISWQRSYWIPMTIAVVLKPDFATTFSRGFLRLGGTFAGLVLATILYHLLPNKVPEEVAISQLLLVGVFTFAMRSIGPANYGVFSVCISGLIVFLVAATGISPKDVVFQRAINTAAGGAFALFAYAVWPTWERTQVNEVLARFLDVLRNYFHQTALRCGSKQVLMPSDLDEVRDQLRRARSEAEASVDRVKMEPGTDPKRAQILLSILGSSRGVAHCVLGFEATLLQQSVQCGDAFRKYTTDVDFTLYFLSNALRTSNGTDADLPKLREDYRQIIQAAGEFKPNDLILVEADHLTVALNTLREQVMKYVHREDAAVQKQEQ